MIDVNNNSEQFITAIMQGIAYITNVDGDILLNLKDVAIGLGFVREQNRNGSITHSIRWANIKNLLGKIDEEYLHHPVGANLYINESDFYELAAMSNSAVGIAFRKKVFREIIPAIRKTGAYISENATPEQVMYLFENQVIEFFNRGGKKPAQRIRQLIDSKELNKLKLIESFDYIYERLKGECRNQFINSFKYALEEAYNRALMTGGKQKKLAMESFRTKAELLFHIERVHHKRDNYSHGQTLRRVKDKLKLHQ